MFDFFGLKKTRNRLIELEWELVQHKHELEALEKVIDKLRKELEKTQQNQQVSDTKKRG